MNFENFSIGKVVIHEVFRRQSDRQVKPPVHGTALIHFEQEDLLELESRVVGVLDGRCMPMQIVSSGPESALHLARTLVDDDDELFVGHSANLANMLASAQTALNIPGGVLVVFSGSVGHPPQRCIGVIKAEPHGGFSYTRGRENLNLKYIKDLILTPQARLYKLGIFVEVDHAASRDNAPNGWEAFVYDELVSNTRDRAAQYFYENFLGCNKPVNAARQTKAFFDLTKKFIQTSQLSEDEKIDLNTGLYTFLKVDVAPTFDRRTFANQYLQPNMRDAFDHYMESNHFPATLVQKDLSNLSNDLKRRNFIFNSDIRLSVPADRFKDLVTIESVQGEAGPGGTAPEWTRITVRDRIRSER